MNSEVSKWLEEGGGVPPPPINPRADLEYMKTPEYEANIEIAKRIADSISFNPPKTTGHEYFEYVKEYNNKVKEAIKKEGEQTNNPELARMSYTMN